MRVKRAVIGDIRLEAGPDWDGNGYYVVIELMNRLNASWLTVKEAKKLGKKLIEMSNQKSPEKK